MRAFSFIDLLPIVGVRAKHDVVAANLKGGAYMSLTSRFLVKTSLAAAAGDILPAFNWNWLSREGRKDVRSRSPLHVMIPVLPSICGMDIARHLDAVSWEVVGLGFGAQQLPQEQWQVPFPQN